MEISLLVTDRVLNCGVVIKKRKGKRRIRYTVRTASTVYRKDFFFSICGWKTVIVYSSRNHRIENKRRGKRERKEGKKAQSVASVGLQEEMDFRVLHMGGWGTYASLLGRNWKGAWLGDASSRTIHHRNPIAQPTDKREEEEGGKKKFEWYTQ